MITREKLIEWEHCYNDEDFENICSIIFKNKTELSVKELLNIPDAIFNKTADKLWVITRDGVLPEKLLHYIAVYCAEKALPIFEKKYPNDNRPRDAIAVKKKWLLNEATDAELCAASAAARDASATWVAGAVGAAWAAARAATSDAALFYEELYDYIKEILNEHEQA